MSCNCATYGNASQCPHHTQADFDAAELSREGPHVTLHREGRRYIAVLHPGGLTGFTCPPTRRAWSLARVQRKARRMLERERARQRSDVLGVIT